MPGDPSNLRLPSPDELRHALEELRGLADMLSHASGARGEAQQRAMAVAIGTMSRELAKREGN